MLLKYFTFVSICKCLLPAELQEQAFNVTQLCPTAGAPYLSISSFVRGGHLTDVQLYL